MSYQDSLAICTKCGAQFVFRVEDQRRQAERGEEITPPELCPSCRTPSRAEHRPKTQREGVPQSSTMSQSSVKQEPKTPLVLGAGPHEGSVKWYDPEKGYGFIVHPDGEEVFFHRTGIAPGEMPRFPDGTQVTYMIEQSEKGPQAVDVARMNVGDNEQGAI